MTIPVPREIPLCGVCIEREKTKFGTGNINQAVYRVILPCRTPGCPLPYHMPPVKGNLCLECLTMLTTKRPLPAKIVEKVKL